MGKIRYTEVYRKGYKYMDENFEKLRCEVHKFWRRKENSIIERWLKSIKFKEPIGYYMNLSEKVMEIYTTRPGVLIGKGGKDVREFEKMLSKEFRGQWKVKFIEIRGNFANIHNNYDPNKRYVEITYSNRQFKTAKTAVVAIGKEFQYISDYAEIAKERVCEALSLNPSEVVILDYRFLGTDVMFLLEEESDEE